MTIKQYGPTENKNEILVIPQRQCVKKKKKKEKMNCFQKCHCKNKRKAK